MIVPVEHINGAGVVNNFNLDVSLPVFLKHAALAGQGPGPTLFPTLTRGIGLLLYYQEYINIGPGLTLIGFHRPAICDPTELGDFTTIAAKTFADILAKFVLATPFTFTYEAALVALGLPLIGSRPDFFCLSPAGQFSLEAKGRQTVTAPASLLTEAKAQSAAGAIPVPFSYASVTYDLYGATQCRFHDPVQRDTADDLDLHVRLINDYYRQIVRDITGQGQPNVRRIGDREFLTYSFQLFRRRIEFLVDREIEGRQAMNQAVNQPQPFGRVNEEDVYIDRDGIGVSIG
jgi:hypothetical protein